MLGLTPDTEIVQTAAAITGDSTRDELDELVEEAIKSTSNRFLTANVHTPWQILHGILALRQDFQIKIDDRKTSALKWLSEGNEWKGESIVVRTPLGGEFHRFTKPYHFQGHPNQFLAILTMSELGTDYEMLTSKGETVTIAQMLNNAKMTVNDREEITWTLWALARYLPIDSRWTSEDGEQWSMERLVQIQTYADLSHAACGGTHGLFALSLARNSHIYSGKKLRGIWLEADQKIKRYIAEARSLQNEDGTFSTSYFAGPGKSDDFGKRIATSGHILEFLMVAVEDKELQKPWLRKAVHAVANDLSVNRRLAADCGPLYHALHALVLYQDRTGKKRPGVTPGLESSPQKSDKQNPESTPTNEKPASKEVPIEKPTSDKPAVEVTPNAATESPVEEMESTSNETAVQKPANEDGSAVKLETQSSDSAGQATPEAEKSEPSTESPLPLFGGPQSALEPANQDAEAAIEKETETLDPFASPDDPVESPESTQSTNDENSRILEDNALNTMGMSGDQPETADEPLPPTSD